MDLEGGTWQGRRRLAAAEEGEEGFSQGHVLHRRLATLELAMPLPQKRPRERE